MTTTAMRGGCEFFNDHLMALLENEVDDATRAALEQHAVSCADCGSLLADLRSLRAEAASLPKLVPSRDLWTGIAARIEAPVVPIGTAAATASRRSPMRRWMRGALIAASLVGATGLGYFAARRGQTGQAPVAVRPETVKVVATLPSDSATRATTTTSDATRPEASSGTAAPIVRNVVNRAPEGESRAVATMTADYDREILRLRALIDQRRNQLDPATVAIIDRNLQVIDAAIVECKKAIARDPASRFLIESLNQSFQTKVELMRTAALLPSRT